MVGYYVINVSNVMYFCRVLISAVSKATTKPKLHFFNNCFGDEYMDRKSIIQYNIIIIDCMYTLSWPHSQATPNFSVLAHILYGSGLGARLSYLLFVS